MKQRDKKKSNFRESINDHVLKQRESEGLSFLSFLPFSSQTEGGKKCQLAILFEHVARVPRVHRSQTRERHKPQGLGVGPGQRQPLAGVDDPVAGCVGLFERRPDDGVDVRVREPQPRVVRQGRPKQLPELSALDRARLSQVVEAEGELGLLPGGGLRVEHREAADEFGEVKDGVLRGVEGGEDPVYEQRRGGGGERSRGRIFLR